MNNNVKHAIVPTELGSIMVGNAAPGTVTLDIDDTICTRRPILLEIDEAHQLIDALQNAIRQA